MKFIRSLKSMSKEAKAGIIIATISIVFFCSVLLIRNLTGEEARAPITTIPAITTTVPDTTPTPSTPTPSSDDKGVVVVEDEVLARPFDVDVEIVGYFFDLENSDEQNAKAYTEYSGLKQSNVGVDYSYNGEKFPVYASFSGVVVKVVENNFYGVQITIRSTEGLTAVYQSLSEANVSKDEAVTQGQLLGQAGNAEYGYTLGNRLHFAIYRSVDNGDEIKPYFYNPEKFYDEKIKNIG